MSKMANCKMSAFALHADRQNENSKVQNVIEETFKRKKYIFKKVILINFVKKGKIIVYRYSSSLYT